MVRLKYFTGQGGQDTLVYEIWTHQITEMKLSIANACNCTVLVLNLSQTVQSYSHDHDVFLVEKLSDLLVCNRWCSCRVKQRAGLWNRLFVWETRAGWRSSLLGKWYLAIVMSGMCLALGMFMREYNYFKVLSLFSCFLLPLTPGAPSSHWSRDLWLGEGAASHKPHPLQGGPCTPLLAVCMPPLSVRGLNLKI